MAKYTTQAGHIYVVDGSTVIRNGKRLKGMKFVGGFPPGLKRKATSLEGEKGYELIIKAEPAIGDSLFYLPAKSEDREDGWQRNNPFQIFISADLYDRLKERKIEVASGPIEEIEL